MAGPSVAAEDLEAALIAWDRRCRGYDVWDFHAAVEPAYRGLVEDLIAADPAPMDDGRRPSLWQLFRPVPERPKPVKRPAPPVPPPFRASALVEMQLILPERFVVKPKFAAELIASFHNLSHPVSFEALGVPEGVIIQLAVAERDTREVRGGLQAFFPEIAVRENTGLLAAEWHRADDYATIIDFGLSEFAFRRLRSGPDLETDPLIGIIGALNSLEQGELGLVQVLFSPAIAPWGADLYSIVERNANLAPILPLVRAKFGEPLLGAVIRVATVSAASGMAFDRARMVGNALIAATRSDMNTLIPLDNDGYSVEDHTADVLLRETHRSGILLNLSELLALVHPPTASVRSDRLERQSERTKQVPRIAQQDSVILGENEHEGEVTRVGLSVDQRLRHTYVVGASGTGKSTLLLSMIRQDIEEGRGAAVLDPHGDLIDDVLARVPEHRGRRHPSGSVGRGVPRRLQCALSALGA